MPTAAEYRLQLMEFARTRTLVQFRRRFDERWIRGYVLGVGPQFFLLAGMTDYRFSGFSCLRIGDVRQLRADSQRAVAAKVLRLRGEKTPRRPGIILDSMATILASASKLFPLVVVYREAARPDVCWVGRMIEVDNKSLHLLDLNPDATWDKEPTQHRLREITCVEVNGDYETALYLAGGEPPSTLSTRAD